MREPARTPEAARRRYTRILQNSLSCLTQAHWYVGPSPRSPETLALALNEPIRLQRKGDLPRLLLEPDQVFKIIPDERFEGEWKASTLAYVYSLQLHPNDAGDREAEILAWHWHPLTNPERPGPHVHVRAVDSRLDVSVSKLHIPTGRVSFEEVIGFLISDFHVRPVRPDWEAVIHESDQRFRAFRTWS